MTYTSEAKDFQNSNRGEFYIPEDTGKMISEIANTPYWIREWFMEEGIRIGQEKERDGIHLQGKWRVLKKQEREEACEEQIKIILQFDVKNKQEANFKTRLLEALEKKEK